MNLLAVVRFFRQIYCYMNNGNHINSVFFPETQVDKIDLARAVYREFHTRCFWFLRKDLSPTAADIPEIARGLREHGGRRGYELASRLCP